MPDLMHLVPGDPKFVGYIVNYFQSVAPERNRFIVLGDPSTEYEHLPELHFSGSDHTNATHLLSGASAVITHGMYGSQVDLINRLPPHTPVAWLIFGAEYHHTLPEFTRNLFYPSTRSLMSKLTRSRQRISRDQRQLPFHPLRWARRAARPLKSRRRASSVRKGMRRANIIGICIPEEYQLVRDKLDLHGEWSWFSYYNIEDTVGTPLLDATVNGEDVLLGNSSSPSNNHLEAFRLLSRHRSEFGRVIVPLSYGDAAYREAIIARGREILGEKLHPLPQFLDRIAYNRQLLSCKVAIMNHRRQQAFGNIFTALWLGSRIYLPEESTIRAHLKRSGLHVFSIENDLAVASADYRAFDRLPLEAAADNRARLRSMMSRKRVLAGARAVVAELDKLSTATAPHRVA